MAQKDVTVKDERAGGSAKRWPVGEAFVYRSSIWKVKGVYLTSSPSGGRDAWWILGETNDDGSLEGGR